MDQLVAILLQHRQSCVQLPVDATLDGIPNLADVALCLAAQLSQLTEVYFARMGVRFIAINNGIDNANPDSTEFAGILNIMNDWYLRDMSRKTRSAAQQIGRSGRTLTNNPCFGYVKNPNDRHHWLIDPEAADTVRRIFELAAGEMSQLSICRTMVKERRVTPGY